MAFVLNQTVGFSCSGTVVAPNIILTAGHCAVNLETGVTYPPAGYRVVTGNVNWASPEREVSKISRVLVYPHFKINGSLSGWGDAALLVLSSPTSAPAIPLATSANSARLHLGTKAMIAGWGNTYYSQWEPTEQLMWANTIVEGKRCDRLPDFRFEAGICTIDPPSYRAGACNGDSGGPLLAAGSNGQGLVEIGITHGGYGHCLTRAPDLFTRADLISSWADRWIAALNPAPS
jgi:secreted trypsin-like serine protease